MNTTHKSISITRLTFLATTLLGLLCLAPTAAHAAKLLATVTPESLQEQGFSMKLENQKDGTVEFTLIRDLSKARSFPADSGLRVSRFATLRVCDKSGLLAQCGITPGTRQQNMVTYRFTIRRDCVAYSSFTLAENDDYKDELRESLIGGGTHYEFDLALFAEHPSEDKASK